MYMTGSWKEASLHKADILTNIWQKQVEYTKKIVLFLIEEFDIRIVTNHSEFHTRKMHFKTKWWNPFEWWGS